MFKELFELWSEKVQEAKTVKIKEYDRFKDRIVLGPDGTFETLEADPPHRKHKPATIASIATYLEMCEQLETVRVWYDRNGVIVILDNTASRQNTLTMSLSLSPQFQRLQAMASHRKAMSQKETIQLVRLEFRDCAPGNLADLFRQVKFSINTEGQTEVQKTKVSVGKSTLAAFHGMDALPDEVAFTVPVFDGKVNYREPVMVAIDPDPATQTFQLIPFPGEIEAALQRAEERLGAELRDKMPEGVPVIFGTP